jgi:hypothetical protein
VNCKYSLISAAVVPERTALLIHCSTEEAKIIRERAALQRRTISGCVLNVLMRALPFDERLFHNASFVPNWTQRLNENPFRSASERTSMLLRCSVLESDLIRLAATRGAESLLARSCSTL